MGDIGGIFNMGHWLIGDGRPCLSALSQRWKIYAFMGASLSSEQRMRTAAVIFPSSNFEEIAVALTLSSMFFLLPKGLYGGG